MPLRVVLREVVRRNRIVDGLVYLQVTRGVAPRAHAFPPASVRPTLVVTARRADPAAQRRAEQGIEVITVPETRWSRVDIKTVSLLPNVLAKETAKRAGAHEAWFVDPDGKVNEGSASNAWIVSNSGELLTAPVSAPILRGVTRMVILETAAKLGLAFAERRSPSTRRWRLAKPSSLGHQSRDPRDQDKRYDHWGRGAWSDRGRTPPGLDRTQRHRAGPRRAVGIGGRFGLSLNGPGLEVGLGPHHHGHRFLPAQSHAVQ
jgi:hypothetical protein